MKVLGGIKGIANNQQALDEYFLITFEIGDFIECFANVFQVSDSLIHKRTLSTNWLQKLTNYKQTQQVSGRF